MQVAIYYVADTETAVSLPCSQTALVLFFSPSLLGIYDCPILSLGGRHIICILYLVMFSTVLYLSILMAVEYSHPSMRGLNLAFQVPRLCERTCYNSLTASPPTALIHLLPSYLPITCMAAPLPAYLPA